METVGVECNGSAESAFVQRCNTAAHGVEVLHSRNGANVECSSFVHKALERVLEPGLKTAVARCNGATPARTYVNEHGTT